MISNERVAIVTALHAAWAPPWRRILSNKAPGSYCVISSGPRGTGGGANSRGGGQTLALDYDVSKPSETERLVARPFTILAACGYSGQQCRDLSPHFHRRYDRRDVRQDHECESQIGLFSFPRDGQCDEAAQLGTHCECRLDGRANRRDF